MSYSSPRVPWVIHAISLNVHGEFHLLTTYVTCVLLIRMSHFIGHVSLLSVQLHLCLVFHCCFFYYYFPSLQFHFHHSCIINSFLSFICISPASLLAPLIRVFFFFRSLFFPRSLCLVLHLHHFPFILFFVVFQFVSSAHITPVWRTSLLSHLHPLCFICIIYVSSYFCIYIYHSCHTCFTRLLLFFFIRSLNCIINNPLVTHYSLLSSCLRLFLFVALHSSVTFTCVINSVLSTSESIRLT